MKSLTQAEYDDLLAARRQRDEILALMGSDDLADMARYLVRVAEMNGLVLTIEQRSIPPWRMGAFESIVSVRPARVGGTYPKVSYASI